MKAMPRPWVLSHHEVVLNEDKAAFQIGMRLCLVGVVSELLQNYGILF
jgi:hypothetical protein